MYLELIFPVEISSSLFISVFFFKFTSDYGFSVLDLNIRLLYSLRIASVPRFQGGPLSDTGKTFLGILSNSLKVYSPAIRDLLSFASSLR